MEFDDQITLLAIKFVCDENKKLCRLCFSSNIKESSYTLESIVKVQTSYCNSSVSFGTLLDKLRVPYEPLLPKVLCNKCATIVLHSYLFQQLIEFSNKQWSTLLRIIDNTLTQLDSLNLPMRSAFAIIEKTENLIFTSHQRCTAKTKHKSMSKINKLIQSCKNKSTANNNNYVCEECGKMFRARYLLTKHIKSHNNSRHPCPDCPKVFRLPTYLEVHAEKVHFSKKLHCSKCPKKFSTRRLLKYHLKTEHIPVNCDDCKIEFPSKKALRNHVNHHKVNTCPHCNKQYTSIKYFKLHTKYCGKIGHSDVFICDICNKVYQGKHGLKSHMRTEHGFGKVLCCKWCNKNFDAISRLNDHIVTHTKEKKFHCDKCGGKFVSKKSLTNHVRLHTGERPYPCGLCEERFLCASRRLEHQRRKHFEPAHKCTICSARFVSAFESRKHLQRHFNPSSKLYITEADNIRFSRQILELADKLSKK